MINIIALEEIKNITGGMVYVYTEDNGVVIHNERGHVAVLPFWGYLSEYDLYKNDDKVFDYFWQAKQYLGIFKTIEEYEREFNVDTKNCRYAFGEKSN